MLIKMVAGDVRPIGIFDSGAGGLSILREVQKIAPHENLIYFGKSIIRLKDLSSLSIYMYENNIEY